MMTSRRTGSRRGRAIGYQKQHGNAPGSAIFFASSRGSISGTHEDVENYRLMDRIVFWSEKKFFGFRTHSKSKK
jgi:hypothetical protein